MLCEEREDEMTARSGRSGDLDQKVGVRCVGDGNNLSPTVAYVEILDFCRVLSLKLHRNSNLSKNVVLTSFVIDISNSN